MTPRYNLFILFSFSVIFWSCAAKKPYIKSGHIISDNEISLAKANIDYELYLVGDIGASTNNISQSDIVDLIKSELIKNEVKKSVVFLGNSFHQQGLIETENPDFDNMDLVIDRCIKELKNHTDKVYYIPGNTEWFDGTKYSSSAVQLVEEYIESKVNNKNIFSPSSGCGQPQIIDLTDDLMLVLIDSQWVLQGDDSDERKRYSCGVDTDDELTVYLQDILARNKNKNVIISAHHPVYSNGVTGGNRGIKEHLLPLPVIGSLINGIKKINGGPQKFGHPQYEAYRSVINTALSNFEGVIHASAHDKNLQYHIQNDNHFVVSGSGNAVDFCRKRGTADFSLMKKGFAKIIHTKNLELWLEFLVPSSDDPKKAISVFKKRLYKKEKIDYQDKNEYPKIEDYPKQKKVVASTNYAKRKLGMGSTYRKEWGTEIEVPVLLLNESFGGLKPVQQGGGFQTKSLRLENEEGQQWVLRSIDKDATKVVPFALRKTFFQDLMQDGMSAAHPYGALVIPKLAEASKIYHANPKVVWLPKQKALGDYNHTMAERLFLFEERPGGNMVNHTSYGGAIKSINTPKLIEKLTKNHKHSVDQKYVLRARLFDLLIGDWDRHDDQWRWGIYPDPINPDHKIYRAIPRDRDQVFFKNDGLINYIASRPYFTPSLRKFDEEIDMVDGLSFNARHFDRHFLSEMNMEDYVVIAKDLQALITDEVIEEAMKDWPEEIYNISGDEIIKKLKVRRKNLVKTAEEFYKYLSKEVTVIGTNGKNIFAITALNNDKLEVKLFHQHNKKEQLIWYKEIDGKDCAELRLFGLKKDDVFNFYGNHKSSIKIRLVGGSGIDYVNNESSDLKILAYDRKNGMTLNGNPIISKLKNQKGINSFDRKDWKLNSSIHFPMISFYTDEGIGLSYNILWRKNGFRKNPFKSNHALNVGYFWANKAIVANYSGHWTSVFGPDWDFRLDTKFSGPTFAQFFYGLGNQYNNYGDIFPDEPNAGSTTFHIVRGIHLDINPHFVKNLGNKRSLSVYPTVEYLNFDDELNNPSEQRFIFSEEAGRSINDYDNKLYAGIGLHYTSNRVNSPTLPTRGYVFNVGAKYRQSLFDSDFSNVTFTSDVAAYIPFSPTHKIVFATNIGASYTLGDYEFFHANYLSNASRLRGFKTNRFAGDAIVYQSSDLRIKLFQGKGSLKTGLGVFGSFDYGRAFLDDENVDDWHTSYGAGIYLAPLDLLGFKIGYFKGKEDTQLTIGGALSF